METGGVTPDLPETDPYLYEYVRLYLRDRTEEARREERRIDRERRLKGATGR